MRTKSPQLNRVGRSLALGTALLASTVLATIGCAARSAPPAHVDLAPAREALEHARLAGTADEANECFVKAQGHLNEAESLAATRNPEKARQAEWLARLSLVESHCAAAIARAVESQTTAQTAAPMASRSDDVEKLQVKLRRSEEEQRKLEERVAVLQRTLEVTETEVIRAKAKLKGIETKAEAASAIAEARILMRRLQEEKGRNTPALNLSQEKLDAAVEQLQIGDFSLAAFYALQAQEILEQVRRGLSPDPDRPPPKKQYLVQAQNANIRKDASTTAPVLGKAPKGATLDALAVRNEWVKVSYQGLTGWVARSLLE